MVFSILLLFYFVAPTFAETSNDLYAIPSGTPEASISPSQYTDPQPTETPKLENTPIETPGALPTPDETQTEDPTPTEMPTSTETPLPTETPTPEPTPAGPVLTPVLTFLTNPIQSGEPLDVQASIINSGTTASDVTVTFDIPYTLNPLDPLPANDGFTCVTQILRALHDVWKTVSCTGGAIGSGETSSLLLHFIAPNVSSIGATVEFTATVTPGGETAKGRVLIYPIALKPDLVVYAKVLPKSVHVGLPATYYVTVTNSGPIAADQTTLVAYYPDGTTETQSIPALNPGNSAYLSFVYTPQMIGNLQTSFIVDPNNTLDEVDENNNYTSTTLTVVEAQPDLTISSFEQPQLVTPGSPFVRTVTVANVGDKGTDTFYVKDNFSGFGVVGVTVNNQTPCYTLRQKTRGGYGPVIGYSCQMPPLNPGEQAVITATLTAPLLPNNYTNTVSIDPTNLVVESNEANNIASYSLTVEILSNVVDWK